MKRGILDLRGVLRAVRTARLPLLGSVDEYDDTVFNRAQVALVLYELDQLELPEDMQPMRSELAAMAAEVRRSQHRYLALNGIDLHDLNRLRVGSKFP